MSDILATLGEIEFQLLTLPSALNLSADFNYVEHDKIMGKPSLQKVGGNLRTLSLDFRFHINWCDPKEQYEKLLEADKSNKPLPLVLGEEFMDEWVIISLTKSFSKLLPDASLWWIDVSVRLKEYVGTETAGDDAGESSGFVRNSAVE